VPVLAGSAALKVSTDESSKVIYERPARTGERLPARGEDCHDRPDGQGDVRGVSRDLDAATWARLRQTPPASLQGRR
jgi:hypothetical protein